MARFTAALVALIAVTGWILAQAWTSSAERKAISISAVIVVLIQIVTFGLVQLTKQRAMLAGWGVGILIRTLALVLYGLLFAKLLGLPLTAALVSFAVFMFASLLLESFLIAYAR
jgi:hypothetical protein